MAGTEYFGETTVQRRDHIPVNSMRKSHNQTFAALLWLSTTTHYLLTINSSEISLNNSSSVSPMRRCADHGRFPFRKKNPEISVGAKVEFPIGKKLFHLVVNTGTSRCPTVDLELVQTTRKVNGTRHSVRKFQPGKRAHLFRFSTFSGNFPVGRADEMCSIYRRTRNSGNFD